MILVGKEFLNVFLDDLLESPTNRKVDFNIDLIPSTTLISKTSYRITPIELIELEKQLQ